MSDTSLTDDLAYVRDLAEAGQSAPLLGGRFLAWWGGLTTLAYGAHYGIESGLLGLPNSALAFTWGGYILIGLVGHIYLATTLKEKPGGSSIGNQVEGTVWMAAGFALFAYFGTLVVKSAIGPGATAGFESSLPIVFAAYGIGLMTSGYVSKQKVLTYAGIGAFAMLALAVWFSGSVTTWAIAALAAFLTVFVPGLILMKREPKNVI
ncbi:MAG: hypothetical protein AAGF20_05085 [Pseudomonadota bacterium]